MRAAIVFATCTTLLFVSPKMRARALPRRCTELETKIHLNFNIHSHETQAACSPACKPLIAASCSEHGTPHHSKERGPFSLKTSLTCSLQEYPISPKRIQPSNRCGTRCSCGHSQWRQHVVRAAKHQIVSRPCIYVDR